MKLPSWPWMLRGKPIPARSGPRKISLTLEALEDRLAPSTLTHAQWRRATFHLGDVAVANLPNSGIGAQSPQNLQAQSTAADALINLDRVFANYAYRGDGYSVAVIDTGIDYTHPDLG